MHGYEDMEIQGQLWTIQSGSEKGQRGKAIGIVFRNIRLDEMIEMIMKIKVVPCLWFSNLVLSKSC